MKKLFIVFSAVITLFFYSCAGVPGTADQAPDGQVVQNKTVQTAETAASEENKKEQPAEIWKPEKEIFKFTDGSVDKTVEYSYEGNGNILESVEKDGMGNLIYNRVYSYSGGRLEKMEVYDINGLVSYTEYETDNDGNILKQIEKDKKGNVQSIISYEYSDGVLVKSEAMDASENPRMIMKYVYGQDKLVSVEYLLPGGQLDAKLEKTYESGLLKEEKTLLSDGSVETAVKYFYTDNILSKAVYYAGSVKLKYVEYQYDENGNITEESWFNSSGKKYQIIERSWISFQN